LRFMRRIVGVCPSMDVRVPCSLTVRSEHDAHLHVRR
jgi:hypothetical protein